MLQAPSEIEIRRVANGWVIRPPFGEYRGERCDNGDVQVAATIPDLLALIKDWAGESINAARQNILAVGAK